jgi:hypothetical protein
MTADPFGGRIHYDVSAKLDRAAEIGRRESVVDQQRHFCVMRDLGDLRNIEHLETGITDGFSDQHARIGTDR